MVRCNDRSTTHQPLAAQQRRVDTDLEESRLEFHWTKGTLSAGQLGDPVAGDTRYALCVYDGDRLLLDPVVAPGAAWRRLPRGVKFSDQKTNADGVSLLQLATGTGRASIAFVGRGPSLVVPALPLASSEGVTVQLVKGSDDGTTCWEATFTAPYTKDTSTTLKDRNRATAR